MKTKIAALVASLCLLGTLSAGATDFFDTSKSDDFFNVGLRLGINTSNRTIEGDYFNKYHNNSWGLGLEAGAVADINFRDWLTIQPGFFFECRNGNFTYVNVPDSQLPIEEIQYGHWRRYVGTIPVLASIRFNISDDVRWSVEGGPYWQFSLGHSEDTVYIPLSDGTKFKADPKGIDFGIKLGTGIHFLSRYSLHIHYLMGMKDAWKTGIGGRNKTWTFTVGYRL